MGYGERLREFRLRAHLGVREAAKRSHIDRGYLSKLENDLADNPADKIVARLAATYNTTPDLLTGRSSLQAINRALSIPVLASIPCGLPSLVFQEGGELLHVAEASLGTVNPANLYALRVSGNSLIGDGIQDGDFLIVDRTAPFVDGAIYIVCIDGDCCARHVHKQGDRAILRSSSDLQDIEAEELDIQGKVIAANRMQRF